MDAPKNKEDLVQAWHMQRALLEKQNIEIDRLRKEVYTGIATIAKFEVDTDHLKETIEQLTKKKEWLINQYAEILWDYTKMGTRAETKETILKDMQQALEEK